MSTLTADRQKVFDNVKEAPSIILFLAFVAEIGVNWLYVNFLYTPFTVVATYTNGAIGPLLVLSLLKLAFIVGGVIGWIGAFKPHNLGLRMSDIKVGLLTTFFLWGFLQVIAGVASSLTGQETGLVGGLERLAVGPVITFLFFFATKAIYDEIVYRSFVLPQSHLKIHRFVPLRQEATLALAVLFSQTIYLIIHLPLFTTGDYGDVSLPVLGLTLFGLGILNALVFLRTHNAIVCAGLHTLWFYPLLLVDAPMPTIALVAALGIGVLVVWPMLPMAAHVRQTWPTQNQRLL